MFDSQTTSFDIGDMVENTSLQGTKGIVIQKDAQDFFFRVDWLIKDEDSGDPVITTHSLMELRRLSRPARC